MNCVEHYFENLLFDGEDIKGNPNKNALTKDQQEAVEDCMNYVLYTIFNDRTDFKDFIENRRN